MKISVITVCKNAGNAIERTLLSVVSQNCFNENIEYIIVDGASSDKTVEIIQQYADKYPIKWISEPDSGIYNAMNKGIKMATGEYLLFLNAGDYLVHHNVIKSLMNLFETSEFDVIHGSVLYINPISEQYFVKTKKNPDIFFFFENSLAHQAVFYKRTTFDRFGLYDEKFTILADNVFNKKIFCDEYVATKHIDHIISVCTEDGVSSTNITLLCKERKDFQQRYFSKEDIYEVQKRITILKRDSKKSLLRFLSKMFSKLHKYWINR